MHFNNGELSLVPDYRVEHDGDKMAHMRKSVQLPAGPGAYRNPVQRDSCCFPSSSLVVLSRRPSMLNFYQHIQHYVQELRVQAEIGAVGCGGLAGDADALP